MCFSATASFGAALALVPVGIYCVSQVRASQKAYVYIGLIPLLFGFQQIFEGYVWLRLEPFVTDSVRFYALVYLLFSHFFWLVWIPLSCYCIEDKANKQRFFYGLIFVGVALGLFMYVPLLVNNDWLYIEIYNRSIRYNMNLLSDGYVSRTYITALYALIVTLPLLMASDSYLKGLGGLVLCSFFVSVLTFQQTFISVWCYFSAVLSLYIVLIIRHKNIPMA